MTDKECFKQQWDKLLNQVRKMGYGNGDYAEEKEAIIDLMEGRDGGGGDSLTLRSSEAYACGYIEGMADTLDLTITALVDEMDDGEEPEGEECEECQAFIPVVNGGGLSNKYHLSSCSLYDPEKP